LRAAECQEKTGRVPEAVKILEMMLESAEVNTTSEAHEARQKLEALKKA
jgi:polyhydroxyalkanoate synthesis regulator phasin